MAEQALALLLACAKSVVPLNERMHAGHWDKATHKSVELHGRTVGLVGLGAIGLRFARMGDAMGMRCSGFDPYAQDLPDFIRRVDLATIWRESDAISLHCPLTPDNRSLRQCADAGLVQARGDSGQHRARRPDRRSRAARRRALRPGAAAGLDSFAVEPMTAPHPFHGEPKIMLSPHIGGVTGDAYVNMGLGAAKNVLAVLQATTSAA